LTDAPLGGAEFAALMARLGPWGPAPRLAVAVSGGGDSMALALLAAGWGSVQAFIVDHAIRADSAVEADLTMRRLAARGIPARILGIPPLAPGPALPARARRARYSALTEACRQTSLVHLLLAHQAQDQAETRLMRRLRGSGPAGLAGMAAVSESRDIRLVRPLLTIPRERLRATLRQAGLDWVEDPTNRDLRYLRPALRVRLASPDAGGAAVRREVAALAQAGAARAALSREIQASLAGRATLRPEGFAMLAPGAVPEAAMAALLQAIGGAAYPPSPSTVRRLAANPAPATLSGVRLLPAGRLGPGLLMVREAAACAEPAPAMPGGVWDARFRLFIDGGSALPDGTMVGAFGRSAASGLRERSALPAAVLAVLPSLWRGGVLLAVPHIGYSTSGLAARFAFEPPQPVAGAAFLP
jgi:tRNA(Ile)-lysidine synthase